MRQLIGIYGGTFDPPHFGHVIAVKQAKKLLGLDRVIVIPAAQSPHKTATHASASQRLQLTKTAFRRVPYAEVSDIEVRREGPSYTADTIALVRELYSDALLHLICGSDAFCSLASWRRAEEIFASCIVCGLGREQGETDEMRRYGAFLFERFGAEFEVLQNPVIPTSSTELRETLARGENSKFLPPDVYDEIVAMGLYGTRRPSINAEEILRLIPQERHAHVLGVTDFAVRLAEQYGVDADEARTAALLHDITKSLCHDTQLKLCEKYGILPCESDLARPDTLHALTGAAVAETEYGASSQVCSAIRKHSVGAPDMSTLDKIIYIADKCETSRDYAAASCLRDRAFCSLDDCLKATMEQVIRYLKEKGRMVHPTTLAAYQEITKEGI